MIHRNLSDRQHPVVPLIVCWWATGSFADGMLGFRRLAGNRLPASAAGAAESAGGRSAHGGQGDVLAGVLPMVWSRVDRVPRPAGRRGGELGHTPSRRQMLSRPLIEDTQSQGESHAIHCRCARVRSWPDSAAPDRTRPTPRTAAPWCRSSASPWPDRWPRRRRSSGWWRGRSRRRRSARGPRTG